MKKIEKRMLSILLALVMIVTSINYTPMQVEAAVSMTDANNITYTVGDPTGDTQGFTFQGAFPNDNPPKFGYAWDSGLWGQKAISVEVQKEGATVANGSLGEKAGGVGVTLAELTALNLSDGDYTIVFKSDTNKVTTIPLNVSGETSTETGSQETTIEQTSVPEDAEWLPMKDASEAGTIDYYYYVPTENSIGVSGDSRELPDSILFVFGEGLKSATLDGVSVACNGAGVELSKSNITEGKIYELKVVGDIAGHSAAVYFKYDTESGSAESVLTATYNWEGLRQAVASWTAVDGATGYAVYTDDTLYETVTDLDSVIPAYEFAHGTNANNQTTTVGSHTIKVVALFNNESAPENVSDIDSNNLIGTKDFNLYVNYIYGNGTDIWNQTGVNSLWNFTICESAESGDIVRGANVKVDYDTDGSANLIINDVGKHSTYVDSTATEKMGDQAWTIKAAIYDAPIANGEMIDLSFNITGPASLVGQQIEIKCVPDEWNSATGDYSNDIYEEALYTFKDDGKGGAVLHYSNSFVSKNDTYDLLFGLGLLQNPDDENKEPIELNISDTTMTKVYGLKDVTPSAVPNTADTINNGILVNWTTDVPNHLKDDYSYKVFIGDVTNKDTEGNVILSEVTLPEGADKIDSGLIYQGYAEGTYKVVVKSYYDGAETSSVESEVTIEYSDKADLVITGISIPDGYYHIGETVPVQVTIQNIGTKDAVPAAGNLCLWLYSHNENRAEGAADRGIYYRIMTDNKLAAGASETVTIDYTIKRGDDKGGYLFDLKAKADADNVIQDEADENNNIYIKTFKFYEQLGEVILTNDGTNINASWPEHDGTNKNFIVRYIDADTKETVQLETADNTPSITFPEGTKIANNSTVEVLSVHTDGSLHTYAEGTALADLIIESLKVANDIVYVGTAINFVAVVKNIGVAVATVKDGEQVLAVTMTDEALKNAHGTNADVLVPNATSTINITTNYAPASVGKETLNSVVDDINRILESKDTVGTAENNNTKTVDVYAINKGTMNLSRTGEVVTASWTDANTELTAVGYKLTYTSNGMTKTIDVAGTSYEFTEPLDNVTDVIVSAKYTELDEKYYEIASDKAMVDLKITNLSKPEKTYIDEVFDVDVTFQNIGTAQVAAAEGDDMEYYGQRLIVGMESNALVSDNEFIHSWTLTGLKAGAVDTVTLKNVKGTALGEYNLKVKVDAPGFTEAEASGFISESDESNNEQTLTFTIEEPEFIQIREMDWTRLYDTNDVNSDYIFKVAKATYDCYIEYKVLDTSYTDIHFKDLFTQYRGYDPQWMYMGISTDGEHKIINVTDGKSQTSVDFAQVTSDFCNNYTLDKDTAVDYQTLAMRGNDFVDADGNVLIPSAGGDSPIGYEGNGFQFFVSSFAPGKYYVYKIKDNASGEYVTVAVRVTDENGSWIQARASDNSDINALPFYYHSADASGSVTKGSLYYDGSDLGLAVVSVYNGDHISVTTDTTKPLNLSDKWYIELGYGAIDENNNFYVPDTVNIDGQDINNDFVTLNPSGIMGRDGTNTINIKLPEFMKEIPVHSELGGVRDDEYYYMKVYYDPIKEPGEYVPVPIKVSADIPKIEHVGGLAVASRGEMLSVSWTNTITQDVHGYLYDVYIDGELVSENIPAGSYNYTGYDVQTIGKNYNVRVIAKWCEQTIDAAATLVIEKPKEDIETLPGEDIQYPNEWVLISGEYILPVANGDTVSSTVNAKIYYYTDEDLNSVVGYNGYYISLNGSNEYFTGNSSKIYVQNGNSTTFEGKKTYDNFYPGQILMNAAQMFATYGNWTTGTELFYTVKVVGENGNTSKNFYFKVVPTDETYTETDEGKWRKISGQSKLPVRIGNTTLEGTVYYYDHPAKTNTYDIVGYNGYYMSIIGKNNYYTGNSTTMEISEVMNDESMETNTLDKLDNVAGVDYGFAGKEIADKAYAGQIIIKSEDTFTVAYGTNYYLLKVNGEDSAGSVAATYVPVKIVVETGDVEVQGFQMNTDSSVGAVSEFNPSFRVVSKASKVMNIKGVLHEVKNYGTVYALDEKVKDDYSKMVIGGSEDVVAFQTTDIGTLSGYTSGNNDEKYNNYYALTFKYLQYDYYSLTKRYAFRAYAILDDGTKVYGKDVYSVDMEEIAENLYQNSKMSSKAAHEYLYDNVLNLTALGENSVDIGKSMLRALKVPNTQAEEYKIINKIYHDIFDYTRCQNGYVYSEHGQFESKSNEAAVVEELLAKLNAVTGTNYTDIMDWLYNHTEDYNAKGMYRTVEYSWENNSYADFDTE